MSGSGWRIAALAACLAVGACSRATAPVDEGPPPARLRALDFTASLGVGESAPQELNGEVRITNRGPSAETLVFEDGCPVRLRVYEVEGSRVAPVWEGPMTCSVSQLELAIPPGGTEVLAIPPSATPDILQGGLSDGPYRVTVWLAPDHRVIEIEAGIVELSAS